MNEARKWIVLLFVLIFLGLFPIASQAGPLTPVTPEVAEVASRSQNSSDSGDSKNLEMVRGEILRFYEERAEDWSSYVLVRDFWGQDWKFFVNSGETLIQYRMEALDPHQLTGGMKVTVLFRKARGAFRASVVRIDGMVHG